MKASMPEWNGAVKNRDLLNDLNNGSQDFTLKPTGK